MSEVLLVSGIAGAVLVVLFIFVFSTGCAPRWVLSWQSYCVRRCKQRKSWNWTLIEPGLFLGSLPRFPCHLQELRNEGVGAVLALNETWELGLSPACMQDCDVVVRQLATPDFFAPRRRDIVEAVTFIRNNIRQGISVYVHCNGGKGRSAVCIICYLILEHGWSPDEAFQYVREKRKIADMKACCGLHKQWRAVKAFARDLKKAQLEVTRGPDGSSSAPSGRYLPKHGSAKVVPLQASQKDDEPNVREDARYLDPNQGSQS